MSSGHWRSRSRDALQSSSGSPRRDDQDTGFPEVPDRAGWTARPDGWESAVMFPSLRGGPGAGRGVVLALLAVAIGAAVLLAGGDEMSTGSTRLAVTGTTPAPARVEIEPSPASDSP